MSVKILKRGASSGSEKQDPWSGALQSQQRAGELLVPAAVAWVRAVFDSPGSGSSHL